MKILKQLLTISGLFVDKATQMKLLKKGKYLLTTCYIMTDWEAGQMTEGRSNNKISLQKSPVQQSQDQVQDRWAILQN
jgi:hypothetical protein